MDELHIKIGPDGSMRAIHTDDFPFKEMGFAPPVRASHVEPIQSGPNAGRWFVDMTPLGELFNYCLWPPFDRRDQALAAEQQHVEEKWVLGQEETKT